MLKSSTNTIWTNMLHHIKLTCSSNLTSTYSFIQIYRGVLVSLVINYTLVFAYVGQDSRSRPHEPFGHCSEILAGQKVQCAKYTHLKTCCRISTGKLVVVLFVSYYTYILQGLQNMFYHSRWHRCLRSFGFCVGGN